MIALSNIAGKDIYGRGNSHTSVAPILTIVRNLHTSAGCAECPLDSHSLSLWIKDSAAKYEVTARAPKIDFSVTLPLMYEANFSEQNNKCFLEKLRDWV